MRLGRGATSNLAADLYLRPAQYTCASLLVCAGNKVSRLRAELSDHKLIRCPGIHNCALGRCSRCCLMWSGGPCLNCESQRQPIASRAMPCEGSLDMETSTGTYLNVAVTWDSVRNASFVIHCHNTELRTSPVPIPSSVPGAPCGQRCPAPNIHSTALNARQ